MTASSPPHPSTQRLETTPPELKPRERILDTARVLFYRRGINNVGIDEIISTANVAKATFYKHFPSKNDLILEFMRHGDRIWREWLETTVEKLEPDPSKRLMAVWDALEQWFSLPFFRGCLLTNVVVELAQADHPARTILQEHKESVRAYFARLATDAKVPNPETLSRQWLMLLEGATTAAHASRNAHAASEQAREMARAFFTR